MSRFLRNASVFAVLSALYAGQAFAQATVDDATASPAQMAARLDGRGVTLSNPRFATGNNSDRNNMYGLFSNGIAGANLQIDEGVVLATGTAADALGPNNDDNASLGVTTAYIDADITAIDTQARFNVAILEVDVTLDAVATGIEIDFQFGSEEYPDYVGSRFNDVFAFFITGPGISGTQNFAQAPLGGNVRINNINAGTVGCFDDLTGQDLTQSAFYINNGHVTNLPSQCQTNNALPGPFPVVTEYNGITTLLTARADTLIPGQTYTVKFAIADVADNSWDSGVFIDLIEAAYDRDFSDAPASYGNPFHDIATTLRLGTNVTGETTGYDDANASADSGDDGVTLPAFSQGESATIDIAVSGTGGLVQAWIDWNDDGDFNDADEQIAVDLQDDGSGSDTTAGDGVINLDVFVPYAASIGPTIGRFRVSTIAGLDATSDATDGEVEDYEINIAGGTASLDGDKIVRVYSTATVNPDIFAIPGEDVIYDLTVRNVGTGSADLDSIFLVDRMPEEVSFFTGTTPEFGNQVFGWSETGTGLTTLNPATDVGFSDSLTGPPADFSQCSYTPVGTYDGDVRFICFNPKGAMLAGDPDPEFTISFRARID